jgi:hypothetical protein
MKSGSSSCRSSQLSESKTPVAESTKSKAEPASESDSEHSEEHSSNQIELDRETTIHNDSTSNQVQNLQPAEVSFDGYNPDPEQAQQHE